MSHSSPSSRWKFAFQCLLAVTLTIYWIAVLVGSNNFAELKTP